MGEEDVAHIGNGILLIQSEVSQKEKQMLYANTYIWILKKKKMVLMNLFAGQE